MNLNVFPSRSSESCASRHFISELMADTFNSRGFSWQGLVVVTLAFWLGSSLVLDLVIMPGMYATGMMASSGFASAGYSMFWMFNRVEVLCAAMVLTGVLALWKNLYPGRAYPGRARQWTIALAGGMMAIALIATYWLTPEMGALGIHLSDVNAVEAIPTGMNAMHGTYFGLEFLKISLGFMLAAVCLRRLTNTTAHSQ